MPFTLLSFLGLFADTSTILIAKSFDSREETTFDPFSFFKPFNWVVWACTILTIVFTAMVYRIIQQIYDSTQPRQAGIHIFRTSMAAIGQVMFEPARSAERVLVLSLSFWSMILVATYTANLAGFLIAEREPIYPATSLAEAQRKGVPICIPSNMSITSKTRAKYPKANYIEVGFNSRYDHLLENDCGLVADGYDFFRIAHRWVSFVVVSLYPLFYTLV
jgi:hypothetical protein